jgi:hypothetical protein
MLISYIQSKRFSIRFLFLAILLTHVVFFIQNYSFFFESLRLGFGFVYSYTQLFDIQNTFSLFSLVVAVVTILLSAFNFSCVWEYIQLQNTLTKKLNKKHHSLFGIGTVLALMGTHCASCVAVLFGGLLSTSVLALLPFGGNEIGLVGVAILLYTSYIIIKKLNQPYIC